MFIISCEDIENILQYYGIAVKLKNFSELQRYHYERDDPNSRQVRLIVKIESEEGMPLVIRFKNEKDVTIELIESQCRFAEALKNKGVPTPAQYMVNGRYANWFIIGGYEVIVTIEQFVEHEIQIVDETIARKTGKLLAQMHTIAEKDNLHVDNDVLFNPFQHNDLFAYDIFASQASSITEENKALFNKINDRYNAYMERLAPLRESAQYAVQGDISDCNLYLTDSGDVGVFDFNRAGDNILFCDVVMQAIFEARLMDYPPNMDAGYEEKILTSFLEGYCSLRRFSKEEQEWYPYLFSIIDAFWSPDIRWNEDSLLNAQKKGDSDRVRQWLETIWKRLERFPCRIPV